MKSVLIGVILRGIVLLAGNEMCTVLAVCPAAVCVPAQGWVCGECWLEASGGTRID